MKQFNKNAHAYDVVRGKITYPDALYSTLSSRSPSREAALDIGCGNGVSTGRLLGLFNHVEGCDPGDALIARARNNFPEITFSVSSAEDFSPNRTFDLITSATSFYWMDRVAILNKLQHWLRPGGIFCAYKYDFPVVYGSLRNYIEQELVVRWAEFRDPRLTQYDNTLELMRDCPHLQNAQREVYANIIFLTPQETALFFLSTSYVTRYIDEKGGEEYARQFMAAIEDNAKAPFVAVNFDIHAFIATNRQE